MVDFETNLPLKFSMTKKKRDELRINRIEALTLITAQIRDRWVGESTPNPVSYTHLDVYKRQNFV